MFFSNSHFRKVDPGLYFFTKFPKKSQLGYEEGGYSQEGGITFLSFQDEDNYDW